MRTDNKKIWNSSFIRICFIGFFTSLGISMGETLISKYTRSLGALPNMIGLISSAAAITSLLFTPLSAPLIDFFKKKYVFMIATIFVALSFLGYCFSDAIWLVFLFRLLNGIGKGIWGAAGLAMASEVLPEEKLTAGITYFSLAQAISVAFGPTVRLKILEMTSFSLTFFISALLLFISALSCLSMPAITKRKQKFIFQPQNMIAREAVLPALIIVFLTAAYSTINGFLVIYADQIKVENIGLFFTVYSLVLLVSRPIIGKLTEKCSLSFIVFPALICFGVAMYLVSIAENLIMFIIAAVISAFGYGALQPLIQALCLKSVSVQKRGAASSTSYMGTNLGYLIGPIIGGNIIQHFGYSVMFRSTIICLVCAGIVYMVYQRKEKMI